MLNINLGGEKGSKNIDPKVRNVWKVMDSSRNPDYKYNLNSKEPIPLEDNSVDNWYTSHTLEHVDTFTLPFVFSELYRTLKSDGRIRIVVPDIKVAMKMYLSYDARLMNKKYCTKDPDLPDTYLGQLMGWWQGQDRGKDKYYSGHRTAFDKDTLRYYLRKAGFADINSLHYNVSSPQFQGLDFPRYAGWSLYFEATKCLNT